VSPIKAKIKLPTSNLQWHKVNIYIPKGKNEGVERQDQTKARPKLIRANIKSCSSMSAFQSYSGMM
jgi:hypothetical protein